MRRTSLEITRRFANVQGRPAGIAHASRIRVPSARMTASAKRRDASFAGRKAKPRRPCGAARKQTPAQRAITQRARMVEEDDVVGEY